MTALTTSLMTAMVVATGLAAPAGAAPDSPDPGFGGDGSVVIHSDAHQTYVGAMEVLDDGRTLVLALTGDDPGLELWRLRANGTPDPTFGGGDGVHAFGGSDNYEDVNLAVDPSTGRAYVSAFLDGATFPTIVWRVTGSGSLDPSFGGGTGQVTMPQRLVEDLTTAPGGKLVLAGNDFDANTANLWQLTSTGAPDPDFGTLGTVVLSSGPDDAVSAVLRQPDGRLVAAGSHYSPTSSTMPVYRVTSRGTLDSSFSGDGRTVVDPSRAGVTTSTVWSADLVIRPDGRLVVGAGLNQNAGGFVNTLLVAGLTPSGGPDPRFGTRVHSGLTAIRTSMALQRDGALVVGAIVAPNPSTTGALVRLGPNGTLDRAWSGDGILPLPGAQSQLLVALRPTGQVLAAIAVQNATLDTQVLAFRGTPTPRCRGKLATQFGTRGADRIKGTSGPDVLVGLGGKDKLQGRGGKDVICGSGGRDKLFGGPGRDKLYGQGGKDLLVGNQGRDVLRGGPGKDTTRP